MQGTAEGGGREGYKTWIQVFIWGHTTVFIGRGQKQITGQNSEKEPSCLTNTRPRKLWGLLFRISVRGRVHLCMVPVLRDPRVEVCEGASQN